MDRTDQSQIGAIVIGGEHPGSVSAKSGTQGNPRMRHRRPAFDFSILERCNQVRSVKDLRDEANTVDNVIDVGARYGMKGWVLFPTRDETVVAFSRHRDRLSEFFRVTTACWETVKWAWNKKNTYDLAADLGIPAPRTYNPRTEEELLALEGQLPLAVKPAIKENFFYATGAKAWRADTMPELLDLFRKAAAQIRPEEILVQEIIPGNGQCQYSYCAFFRDGEAQSTFDR